MSNLLQEEVAPAHQKLDHSKSGQDKQHPYESKAQPEDQSYQAYDNPLEEDIRITQQQLSKLNNQYLQENNNQTGEMQQVNPSINDGQKHADDGKKGRGTNIFRNGQRNSSKASHSNSKNEQFGDKKGQDEDMIEKDFEIKCQNLLRSEDYEGMENEANDYLRDTEYKSFKGYFYLGVSLYRQSDFENAIKAFKEAEAIYTDDAQLHYNLGLSYFKLELYNPTVEHWRKCIKLDPTHKFVYNNLAFLFNLHQFYPETINICGQAKLHIPDNHNCHRHWAFALFKRGEMAKAVKKIKKGIEKNPKDADNWIIWGVILRFHCSYKSARHKFLKALKLDPKSETAKQELAAIDRIIDLDNQIPLTIYHNYGLQKGKYQKSRVVTDKKGGDSKNQQEGGNSTECLGKCNFFNNCQIF